MQQESALEAAKSLGTSNERAYRHSNHQRQDVKRTTDLLQCGGLDDGVLDQEKLPDAEASLGHPLM